MINGFWTVTFQAPTDIGAGVVTIIDNEVTGGDTSFTYIGPLVETEDGLVSGELQINRHSKFIPSVIPGLDNYSLIVSGKVSGDSFTLTGKVRGQESKSMTIQGKRRLPATWKR